MENSCGFDAGGNQEWLGRSGWCYCHVQRNIDILRSNSRSLDAARRYNSARGSRLGWAASVTLGILRQVTEAKYSRSRGNGQKHHHHRNPDFGFARHFQGVMLCEMTCAAL